MFNNIYFFIELIFIVIFLIFIIFILIKTSFIKYDMYVNRLFGNGNFIYKNIYTYLLFLLFWYLISLISFFSDNLFFSIFSFFSNSFIIFIKCLIAIFFIFCLFPVGEYFRKNELKSISFEFLVMITLSIVGTLILVSSNDFLTIFLALELQSLAFYVLASYKQVSIFSIESGLKYFILGSFSSGIFVFGISLFYGFTGIYNLIDLKYFFLFERFNNFMNFFILLSLLFIFIALLFKFSAAPFHIWVPDVYEGAPTIITFFFSVVPKFSYFAIFLKLFSEIFNVCVDFYVKFLFLSSCITSLIIGSVAALIQQKIKRLLAYSAITNVGFILIGFSAGNFEGFNASLIYFIIYNLVTVSLFYLILSINYMHNSFLIKNINELFVLLNENFFYCLFFLISLFSLIGLPPLAGFVGKLYLFINSLVTNFEVLFITAAYSSLVSAIIYLRLLRNIFFNKKVLFFSFFIITENNNLNKILVLIMLFNILFFICPFYLFYFSYNLIFALFI